MGDNYPAYKRKKQSGTDKNEFRKQAAEKLDKFVSETAHSIVSLIADGHAQNWQKGWKDNPAFGLPHNGASGYQYKGTNQFLLMLNMMFQGWDDARFCTYKQAMEIADDTHVKKAEKGFTILRPIVIERQDVESEADIENAANINDESLNPDNKIVFFRPLTVFHSSQIENMPDPEDYFEPINWESNNVVETLAEASGMPLEFGGNRAFYSSSRDVLKVPDIRAFNNPAEFYGVMLHEWFHGTGHKDRENRLNNHTSRTSAGLKEYALEELRAELFSIMASKMLGLPRDPENSARYIAHWNAEAENDPKEILKQATQAAKMLNVVMDFIQNKQPQVDWFPDKTQWPARDTTCLLETGGGAMPGLAQNIETTFTVIEEGGSVIFKGPEPNGAPAPKDVEEAFKIQAALEAEYSEGISVRVESHDGQVVVTACELSLDLDNDNSPR